MEFEKVRDIIVETLGCDAEAVTPTASLADDLGADSLAAVELVMALEEAAGISRYRHRKEEAERKLAHTDENLVRVNDKIAELELQVEPLREQSGVGGWLLICSRRGTFSPTHRRALTQAFLLSLSMN